VDPLSVLFWTAAMLAGWRAIKAESGAGSWMWVGLWMGLGFLSKYTALFQWLCWIVLFALWPPARQHLRKPGPYLALLVNLACALPVIIWNHLHGWISAEHVAGNANLDKPWRPSQIAENFFTFLGQEAGLLNPVFFVGIVVAGIAFWRRYKDDLRLIYFFSMGAPLFLVYLGWTFHSEVLPNWIAPSVLPLFCMMVIYWSRRFHAGVRAPKLWLTIGLTLGLAGVVILHAPELVRKIVAKPAPTALDPLRKVCGWKNLAAAVGEARQKLLSEGKPVFIIGGHYRTTGEIAFYLPEAKAGVPDNPLVYFRTTTRPVNQFFFWQGYGKRKGENAIYVELNRTRQAAPESLVKEFETVTDLGLRKIYDRGRLIHTIQLFECRNLR